MSVLVRSAGAMVIAGAALLGSSALAASQPPPAPNCSVADQAGILSGVSASLSAYMFTHPDVNWFFTSLRGLPPDERRAKVDAYLDTSPGVQAELQGIRQPMTDFRARCGLPPSNMPDA
ncbi:heme-binding protein [Mycobacterium sp. 236(2023)]|uniref:heme-binding protein n=1 Tax=Mycobacterium sp. 236(2023) TaxID=3038163 RepID=UPI0024150F30|nr:heme-binding protein [Mycobacterium sp. 236(2023)]MDG4665764.1 heme-binding protein [Mycobacterium sp. 236(2023)]